jgi:hypothetical protein
MNNLERQPHPDRRTTADPSTSLRSAQDDSIGGGSIGFGGGAIGLAGFDRINLA